MQNVALRRPALQSSTCRWSIHADPSADAGLATDGDVTTDKFFHTDLEIRPWWQVDLGDLFLVSQVKIFNRMAQRERLRSFTLLRSCDGESWFRSGERIAAEDFEVAVIDLPPESLARYLRVRLNGVGMLHFRQCEVMGAPCDAPTRTRLLQRDKETRRLRNLAPEGRCGQFVSIAGASVFVDDAYGEAVRAAMLSGDYETRERASAQLFVGPGDRILEVGTAVGVVAMLLASLAGADAVLTFDANPQMTRDARANFARNDREAITAVNGLLANRRRFQPGATARFGLSREFWASRLADGGEDLVAFVDTPFYCLEDEIEKFRANVLVCDIEGGEIELLAEADLSRLRLIILETHYWARGEAPTDALIRSLINKGFDLHLHASRDGVVVLRRAAA